MKGLGLTHARSDDAEAARAGEGVKEAAEEAGAPGHVGVLQGGPGLETAAEGARSSLRAPGRAARRAVQS